MGLQDILSSVAPKVIRAVEVTVPAVPVEQNGPNTSEDGKFINDERWFHPDLMDGARWDQNFPYQFLVLDRDPKKGTYGVRKGWQYTLPIPPESVAIDTNFANATTVTQGGIVEELGGFPLKPIEIAGSTGVMPTRPFPGQPGRANLLTSIFAGTVAAISKTVSAINDIDLDLSGDQKKPPNLIDPSLLKSATDDQTILKNTGYWQARMMVRFLEAYVTFKSTDAGKDCVLAFANWKDEACYLVTPNRVRIRKASDSPLEHKYQITLTAWGRTFLNGPGPIPSSQLSDSDTPGFMSEVLNTLKDAQNVLQDARDTIQAFVADADRSIFEPVREAILITKTALSIPLALIDMPAAIIRDAADTFVAAVAAGQEIDAFGGALDAERTKAKASIREDFARIKDASHGILDRNTFNTGSGWARPGFAPPARANASPQRQQPGLETFNRPDLHPQLMSFIQIDRLRLPPSVTAKIGAEVARVQGLSRGELDTRRVNLDGAARSFDDLVGAGDPNYNQSFGRPAPPASKALSRRTFAASAAIQSVVGAYQRLLSRGPAATDAGVLKSLKAFADRSEAVGMPLKIPKSKYPVPMPYGTTLEQMAQKYLGDPQRVGELIALNGLRAPYVDEVGQTLPLLAPGSGRSVVVMDTPDLHVGMTVYLESNSTPRTKRKVTNVVRRNGEATLTLDGNADLEIYSTIAKASLHIFKPGTINSQTSIFIPSGQEPDGMFRVTGVAEASAFDPLLSAGGVDLLLTPDKDVVITPDGDGRWAVGLVNLVQLFGILMELRQNTLLHHGDRGLPFKPGDNIADAPASSIASAVSQTLAAEPAFGAIQAVRVVSTPPGVRIDTSIEVSRSNLALPLSVDVRT